MRVDTGPVVGRLALSVTHQGFYLVGLHGHTARDQLAARLGDDGIVLDADADVVELLGHAGRRAHVDARLDGDRKSTRLNSSHLVISYAVFCLKKKNTTHTAAHQRVWQHGSCVRPSGL